MRALLLLGLAACASNAPGPSQGRSGPPASLEGTRASADDVVVAKVNGRPVWGSCVAIQAARGVTREVALQQCIDFELLAQAAERRGLDRDDEVAVATRTAMVSRLVARDYEDKYTRKEDFGAAWDALAGNVKFTFHYKHEEYRASAYVRVNVPEQHTPEQETTAHALANEIAAAVAPETGLMAPQLFAIANRVAAGRAIATQEVPLYKIGALEDAYGDALWAIREIGRATPQPVRTKWGWDVIVWTADEPARDPAPDELARELLPDVKRAYFATWVNQIAKGLDIHVELVKDNLPRLEDL